MLQAYYFIELCHLILLAFRPRSLSIPGSDLENIFLLRSPEDANQIGVYIKSNLLSSVKRNSPLSVGLQNQSYFILHSRFVALKELNMVVLALSFRYFLVLFNFCPIHTKA